jgi:hypothetical protein
MAKKLTLKAPGSLNAYGARKHKLNCSVDPSPKGFLSRSIATKGRIRVVFTPGGENKEIAPIAFRAKVKSVTVKLEDVVFDQSDRLGDVIDLVNDDKNVGDFVFEADPDSDLFAEAGDEPDEDADEDEDQS